MAKGARGRIRFPFFLFAFLILLLAGVLAAFLVGCVRTMPRFDPVILAETNMTSTVYDANGEIFTRLHGEENRLPVDLDKTPVELKQAFISTEDVRFYQHFGIDPGPLLGLSGG